MTAKRKFDPNRRNAMFIIPSAEGRRTCKPTKEERDQFERAGIKRVGTPKPWWRRVLSRNYHRCHYRCRYCGRY